MSVFTPLESSMFLALYRVKASARKTIFKEYVISKGAYDDVIEALQEWDRRNAIPHQTNESEG